MLVDVFTLFPEMFKGPISESIIKIAQNKRLLEIKLHNLRDWTGDLHKTADDKPYGGGGGMVMKVEPVYRALEEIVKNQKSKIKNQKIKAKSQKCKAKEKIILMCPQGKKLNQRIVKRLSKIERLVIICGHYEGIDERVRKLVDMEISIGDYVLSSGEIPACVLIDAVARLIPGVLGNPDSVKKETFENNMLEYPQYTRPRIYENMVVPKILLSGNHKKIEEWRAKESLRVTKRKRPDLYRLKSKLKSLSLKLIR